MKATLKMMSKLGLAVSLQMEMFMKVAGKQTELTEQASTITRMGVCMMGSGKTTDNMARGKKLGLMGQVMKVGMRME